MIERLYQIIDDNKIRLKECDLKKIDPVLKGLYFDNVILLDHRIETSAELNSILAEEVGHYFTTTSNILDTKDLHKEKEEEKAHRWAVQHLITPFKLIDAFKEGVSNRFELAEYLDVTEDFIEDSIPLLKKLYGESIAINEYIIHFDPLWVYKSFY